MQHVQGTSPGLTRRRQVSIAGIMAGAALLVAVLVLAGTRGQSQPVDNHLARFVPTDEQLRSFRVETVALRTFRTEITTDGYIAAGGSGGKAHDLPVLPAQAADMLQAENDLAAARVQYRNAAATEDRQHKLYQADGAALKDWQQSQADLATAASALASARNRLRLLGRSDDGKAGAFTVGDNGAVWLVANVREDDAGLVHVGDPVKARLIAYPGLGLAGTVNFMSSVIDPVTHRLVIGARIANPGGQLKPNMLALATVSGGEARQSPAVPQNTIVYDGDQAHLWVVGPGRRLSSRKVTLGRTSDGYVEVTAGLSAGEHIATAGALFIDQAVNGD